MLDFLDPFSKPLVTPQELVTKVTLGGLNKGSLKVSERILMVFLEADLKRLARVTAAKPQVSWRPYRKVYTCEDFTLVLSPIGASNAVAVAEEMMAFGGRVFVSFGYCGTLREGVRPGEVLLPEEAIREEGTSYHYLPAEKVPRASLRLLKIFEDCLKKEGFNFHIGRVWTTDAIYRETESKVRSFAASGCLGVDMETSALLSWGEAKGIEVASILLVSDSLVGDKWEPAFKNPLFLLRRKKLLSLLPKWMAFL